jgi:hypothetical protein
MCEFQSKDPLSLWERDRVRVSPVGNRGLPLPEGEGVVRAGNDQGTTAIILFWVLNRMEATAIFFTMPIITCY